MPRQFNIQNLREAASKLGDETAYRIAKRTGVSESTISRLANGECQPNATTAAKFIEAYPIDFNKLMPVTTETDQAAA